MSWFKKAWAAWGHFDSLLSIWERLAAIVKLPIKWLWGLIVGVISGYIIPWVLGVEGRLIAGVIIAIVIGGAISATMIGLELGKGRRTRRELNILVKGSIRSGSRILATPPHILQGHEPQWTLLNTLYSGGWMWTGDFILVNREKEPVTISCWLAIPTSEDQQRWLRLDALRNPLYKWRTDLEQEMSQIPEHLTFPVDIAPGKHVEGRIIFAVDGAFYEALASGGNTKVLIMAQEKFLEIEDLISSRKIRVSV